MTADPRHLQSAAGGAQEALPLEGRTPGPGAVLETRPDGIGLLVLDPPNGKVNLLGAPIVALLELLVGQPPAAERFGGDYRLPSGAAFRYCP